MRAYIHVLLTYDRVLTHSLLYHSTVQNADDAGSTQFKVLLDGRTNAHKTALLLSPKLAHTQGAALYQAYYYILGSCGTRTVPHQQLQA